MSRRKYETIEPGAKYGRWTVIGRVVVHDEDGKNPKLRCRCVCGREKFVKVDSISPSAMRRNPYLGCNKKSCLNAFKENLNVLNHTEQR